MEWNDQSDRPIGQYWYDTMLYQLNTLKVRVNGVWSKQNQICFHLIKLQ